MSRGSRLAAWIAWLLATALAGVQAAAAQSQAPHDGPMVCIIVRTYWGHGSYGEYELWNMFQSLKRQTHVK